MYSRTISIPVCFHGVFHSTDALIWNVDIAALEMVDEAYLDKEEWIKKSIRTTAKVRLNLKP